MLIFSEKINIDDHADFFRKIKHGGHADFSENHRQKSRDIVFGVPGGETNR
jgi:hypothetical protein